MKIGNTEPLGLLNPKSLVNWGDHKHKEKKTLLKVKVILKSGVTTAEETFFRVFECVEREKKRVAREGIVGSCREEK